MLRITFDLLPGGREDRAKTIGVMELANIKTHADNTAEYAIAMKKCVPFRGALKEAWKRGKLTSNGVIANGIIASEDEALITAFVAGHHREKRGVYDLLFRAMIACGLHTRNPNATKDQA